MTMIRLRTKPLALALIRLLWDSVADNAECTCFPNEPCPQCEAARALGLRWPISPRSMLLAEKRIRRRR